ncbi:unnamed protein product [Umbelopsis vinacea]
MNDGQHTGQNRPLERSKSRKSPVKRSGNESYSSSDDSQISDSDRSHDSEDDSFMEVDSMVRLERLQQEAEIANNIQKSYRNLMTTIRIMVDQLYAKIGEFGAERGEKRKQRQEEPFSHSSATSQKRTRTPSIQRLTPAIQREIPAVQHETVEDVKLAASDTLDVLFQVDQTKAQPKYDRKPRSLLYNIAPTSSHLSKLMVATGIDGNMNFWNSESRQVVKTLDDTNLG